MPRTVAEKPCPSFWKVARELAEAVPHLSACRRDTAAAGRRPLRRVVNLTIESQGRRGMKIGRRFESPTPVGSVVFYSPTGAVIRDEDLETDCASLPRPTMNNWRDLWFYRDVLLPLRGDAITPDLVRDARGIYRRYGLRIPTALKDPDIDWETARTDARRLKKRAERLLIQSLSMPDT